jgi:hypothetical protein
MVAGTTEKDYYNGLVTEATSEQRTWVEARRGESAAHDGDDDRSGDAPVRPEVEGSVGR